MYTKPLASRMDGMRDAPTTIRRPISGAVNFASFLPQNGVQAPGISGGAAGQGGQIPGQLPGHAPGQASPQSVQGQTPIEQGGTQGNLGLNQVRALAALTTAAQTDTSAARHDESGKNFGLPLSAKDIYKLLTRKAPDLESVETAIRTKALRKNTAQDKNGQHAAREIKQAVADTLEELRQKTDASAGTQIGALAARFESGNDGIEAIGYDRHGGTSYGKYQISSRAGTMRRFTEFLKTEAPDLAERFQNAGPANTGGKRGKMPETWKQVASEDPARFEALQDKFIRASHFEPAMRAIAANTGLDPDAMPAAFQEVVFSTAVQHGPNSASRIISRAFSQVGEKRFDPEQNEPASLAKAQENLIRKIYDQRSGQFRSSTETVQAAVKNRLRQEMSAAISMLRQEQVDA